MPSNGVKTGERYLVNDVVSFQCEPGYALQVPPLDTAGRKQEAPEMCLTSLSPVELQSLKNREQPLGFPRDHCPFPELFMQKTSFADLGVFASASLRMGSCKVSV